MGIFLGSKVALVCLKQTTRTCVIHGLARYSFFCFRSKRVDRCVGVEHEEYLEAVDLTRGDHTHLACPLLPCVVFHCSSSTSR